jgi:DNA polymerase III delta prime subunit
MNGRPSGSRGGGTGRLDVPARGEYGPRGKRTCVLAAMELRASRTAGASAEGRPAAHGDKQSRADSAPGGYSAEIVGRDHELTELDRMLERAAAAGHGAICLLTGEPGVGKTSLATAFAAGARSQATVLWGACWAAGAAPAYWPWRQALRTLFDERDPADWSATLGAGAAHAVRLLLELGAEAAPEPEPEHSRFALFDGIATALSATARERPLVVVLDDLHDADAPSLALLEFLGRALTTEPVLFVGTARDREAALREDLGPPLGGIAARVRHLPLRGLGREDVSAMVAARAPGASGQFVAALHERTEGNPFFIEELLALAGGASDPSAAVEMPLPHMVRDAIRARLAPIAPDAGALLGAASVAGLEFPLSTLAAAAGVTPADTLAVLEEPLALGLLVDAGGGGEPRFAFAHALVRETLYEDLPVTRRMELHRAVGEALERRLGQPGEPPLAELAHHFGRAVPVAAVERARDYAELAAEQAMAVSAWEDAARHFGAALELHGQLPADDDRCCDLLLALGRAHARRGDPEAARPTLIDAAGAARRLGAAQRFGLAVIELGAVGLPPDDEDAEVVALLEKALGMLDEGPSALRARLLARLAVQLYWRGPPERIAALVDEAGMIAARLDDPAAQLEVLAQIHLATSGPETPQRLEALDRLLGLAALAQDPEAELQVRIWRVAALTQLGDLRAAATEMEAFARLSARVQQPRWEWYVPLLRAVRALAEGRLSESERLRDEAAALGLQLHGSMAPMLVGALLVSTRWTQRRLGELLEAVTAFVDAHPAVAGWRCVRAAALVDAGCHPEAAAELERLVGPGGVALPRDTTFLSSCALLADAVARLGDAEAARAVYEALVPYAGHNATLPSGGFLGPVARHLGVLAAAFGDVGRARTHLAAAHESAARGHMDAMLELIAADQEAIARTAPVEAGPAPAAEAAPPPEALLRREGDIWTASVGERTVRLRHAKGLTYLALLLVRPGVELHALDLVRSASGDAVGTDGDFGPVLDEAAKAAYRARVEELRADVEEAEDFNDSERAARAREELEAVTNELAAALGLGGRDRRPGSTAERARVNATRAIRSVLRRIAEHDQVLGQELLATVHTGTFCVYRPDARRPLRWRVEER